MAIEDFCMRMGGAGIRINPEAFVRALERHATATGEAYTRDGFIKWWRDRIDRVRALTNSATTAQIVAAMKDLADLDARLWRILTVSIAFNGEPNLPWELENRPGG